MTPIEISSGISRVFVPATVANVGPGFDCFGFGLEQKGDVVSSKVVREPGVRIAAIRGDGGVLPLDTEKNTAGVAARYVWERYHPITEKFGLELEIDKGLSIGSGLGSSAASAVGGAVAAMKALVLEWSLDYDEDLVLEAAIEGEALASGARHADNVAPALYGGFTVVQSASPPHVARFTPKLPFQVAVVTPEITITTMEARSSLPELVPLKDAAANWANAAAMVLALLHGDAELFARCLEDRVVEPHRATRIDGYEEAKRAALNVGVYGCVLGGSGPAMVALAADRIVAERAGMNMARIFQDRGIRADYFISGLSASGARSI